MPRRASGLTGRFLDAVGHETANDVLTPAALARAVVRVLRVEAASLSTRPSTRTRANVFRDLLRTSSRTVDRAEDVQALLGRGPCLRAARTKSAVVLDLDQLGARWTITPSS